jgi:hypothetical protein
MERRHGFCLSGGQLAGLDDTAKKRFEMMIRTGFCFLRRVKERIA